jgi:hypothetical protein
VYELKDDYENAKIYRKLAEEAEKSKEELPV